MVLCAISLGGNVGDVPSTFAAAARQLCDSGFVSDFRMSRLYRTAPMGAHAGDVFFNAAAVFTTELPPLELLDQLQRIENDCGRVRAVHWGPRTLDLDLLLYGDQTIQSPPMASAGPPRLIVPHSALWYRRFVLDPLLELVPAAIHPVFQQAIRTLRHRLLVRPLPIGWLGPDSFPGMLSGLEIDFPKVRWEIDDSLSSSAIVFAGSEVGIRWPQIIHIPGDEAAARQLIRDVLTAALDEPVVV